MVCEQHQLPKAFIVMITFVSKIFYGQELFQHKIKNEIFLPTSIVLLLGYYYFTLWNAMMIIERRFVNYWIPRYCDFVELLLHCECIINIVLKYSINTVPQTLMIHAKNTQASNVREYQLYGYLRFGFWKKSFKSCFLKILLALLETLLKDVNFIVEKTLNVCLMLLDFPGFNRLNIMTYFTLTCDGFKAFLMIDA